MSQELIARSPDLLKLQNDGHQIEVRDGYLIVHHVPYLANTLEVCSGTLIMPLTMTGDIVGRPADHTALWIGTEPYHADGTPIRSLINSVNNASFGNGLIGNFLLSCHLDGREYQDYYDKVSTYSSVISSHAEHHNPDACKEIRRPKIVPANDDSAFVYMDTNSSRANLLGLNALFITQKIAIIGLGGTGSYVLDMISKTPVAEIHLYDNDVFNSHNAFRAPGAAPIKKLEATPYKVDYFAEMYGNMHKHIVPHNEYLKADNAEELKGLDFVFICVDSAESRNAIANILIDANIPFVDAGIGVENINGALIAQVRSTLCYGGRYQHLKHAFASDGSSDDVYATNIQIAEINAMAALLAVLRWKRLLGYYADSSCEDNSVYSISGNVIINSRNEEDN